MRTMRRALPMPLKIWVCTSRSALACGTYHNPKRQYSKHDMTSVVLPLQEVGSKAVES